MVARLVLVVVVLGSVLVACGPKDDFKQDAGPPPKLTDEDRAKMEGISTEEYKQRAALKAQNK